MAENNELLPQGIESASELGRYWIIGVTLGYHQRWRCGSSQLKFGVQLVANSCCSARALLDRSGRSAIPQPLIVVAGSITGNGLEPFLCTSLGL